MNGNYKNSLFNNFNGSKKVQPIHLYTRKQGPTQNEQMPKSIGTIFNLNQMNNQNLNRSDSNLMVNQSNEPYYMDNRYLSNNSNYNCNCSVDNSNSRRGNYYLKRDQSAPSLKPLYDFKLYGGVNFEDENKYNFNVRQQYKQDLDYLIGLRKQYNDSQKKEQEIFSSKIDYMNDRYAYGEIDKKNFLKGIFRGYQDELSNKKAQEKLKKQEEKEKDLQQIADNNYKQDLIDFQRRKKYIDFMNEQKQSAFSYYKLKDIPKSQRYKELISSSVPQKNIFDESEFYHRKIKSCNNKIFDNISSFNDRLNHPLPKNIFESKDDLEYNRNAADLKNNERSSNRKNEEAERIKLMEENKIYEKITKESKLNNQKLYKDCLDNQSKESKMLRNIDSGKDLNNKDCLIMPSYYYSNKAVPVYLRANDSIQWSKEPNKYLGNDARNFFTRDSQYNTLLDYDKNKGNLGDSKLRQNIITCPVNDYYYNKYINKMKKISEVEDNNGKFRAAQNTNVNPNSIMMKNSY